ncbi:hypothetical protein [Candidatus Carsonella ruddii]|nr:hypothetical protein [Candidatus Carsonella ruddii]AGS06643.1 hypothetical protein CRDC_00795 [Candidatus Carsonella ruddii DC]AGS06644.1 hypothetical protein CRDC_00800 [Candidatus Carsonella ruddii DC]
MYKITIKYYDKNIIIINKPVGIEVDKIIKIKINLFSNYEEVKFYV